MRSLIRISLLSVVVVLVASAECLAGGGLRLAADGDLEAADADQIATGSFELRSRVRNDGRESDEIRVFAEDLNATRDAEGRLPELNAFVVAADGAPDVFVGFVRIDSRGRARLRVRNAWRALRGAGIPLRQYAGGAVEIRQGDDVVLSGAVPDFQLPDAGRFKSVREVYGRFVAVNGPRSSPGGFLFRSSERDGGVIRNRLHIRAPGLDTSPNSAGVRPVYRPRIVNAASNRFVELGAMLLSPNLGASLELDTRRTALPGGIVRWSEFDGGRIEVRQGSSVLLTGAIAPFRGLDERSAAVGHARAREGAALVAAPGSEARGLLTASLRIFPRRRTQAFALRVIDLDASGSPYTLVALHASGTETTLGTLATRGAAGAGRLHTPARRGGAMPAGGVRWLGGQSLELRDASNAVLMTGTFPTLE